MMAIYDVAMLVSALQPITIAAKQLSSNFWQTANEETAWKPHAVNVADV